MSRQIEADNPWVLQDTRIRNWVIQPEIQGFKGTSDYEYQLAISGYCSNTKK